MKELIFITLAIPGKPTLDALLMAESIRSFGGNLADSPIWILVPEVRNAFSEKELKEFSHLEAKAQPFPVDPDVLKFPFAAKISAAAFAEENIKGQAKYIVWLDRDNIILRQPDEFLLPAGKTLGYRPVHHKLIGPGWDEVNSPFWELIYRRCEVPEDRIFQMTTHTGEATKPYFNAGTYVTRPERGLLTRWKEAFFGLYSQPEFTAFYEQSHLYAIFVHQAVWTGVLLQALSTDEMQLLSPKINYPLHLHDDIPEDLRPETINELTTLRYENIFDTTQWRENLPIAEPLKSWLESRLRERETSKDEA